MSWIVIRNHNLVLFSCWLDTFCSACDQYDAIYRINVGMIEWKKICKGYCTHFLKSLAFWKDVTFVEIGILKKGQTKPYEIHMPDMCLGSNIDVQYAFSQMLVWLQDETNRYSFVYVVTTLPSCTFCTWWHSQHGLPCWSQADNCL